MAAEPDESNAAAHDRAVELFAARILEAALGTIDILAVYLGDRLGWYRDLSMHGTTTAAELAARTDTDPRYAREWLEQQAATGILELVVAGGVHGFRLPNAAAAVLTDEASPAYLGPLPRMFAASASQLAPLLRAYREGGGVSWSQLGADAREAQADLNRPWFDRMPQALAAVPALESVLSREGARVADIGSGAGWSAIALARAHPGIRVEGFDVDAPSVLAAQANAKQAAVADRVVFHEADARSLAEHGGFDAAFAFECLHDMPDPVGVLTAMHEAVRPGGPVIVMDEAVADELTAPGDEVERLMYGFSLLVCLPDGLSHPSSVGTGTVMRPSTLRRYAQEAGFADIEVLPIEEFSFFRFYWLTR